MQIGKANHRGLLMAISSPFASSTPDAPELDQEGFKILEEGEITLPMYLETLERGKTSGRFTSEVDKPDVADIATEDFSCVVMTH